MNASKKFATLIALVVAVIAIVLCHTTPDHSHLPVRLVPHRPWPVLMINVIGSALRDAGLGAAVGLLPRGSAVTVADFMIAAACQEANLPDGTNCTLHLDANIAGSPPSASDDLEADAGSWREGLEQLMASAQRDAKLTPLGELIVRGQVQQWLATRARLLHAWRKLGSRLLREPVERPIFIVGLPRTGTTFLHNLLRQDTRLRAPLHWELVEPIPAHGVAGGETHIAAVQERLMHYTALLGGNQGKRGQAGAFDGIHPMDARMAEECVVTLAHEFASYLFSVTYDVEGYTRWLLGRRNHGRAMRWHRRVLQYLQLRSRDSTSGYRDNRWLLKTPQFTMQLDDVVLEYPDAIIIQTHRDPAEAVGSSASVHARTFGAASDTIDLRRIGRQQHDLAEEWLKRAAASRARLRERGVTVIDIKLQDLKRDPIAAVDAVYRHLGQDFSATTRARMNSWVAKRQVRYGAHKFSLKDFGLQARSMVNSSPVLRAYCDEFGLKGEGCSPADTALEN